MKTVLIVVGIIVAVVLLLVLGGLGGRMMGRFGSTGFGMMFPFFGCLLGPIFWALVIAGIVWLVINQLQKGGTAIGNPPRETALDVLKTRYAKGEITKEQFEQMKNDIGA